MSLSMRPSGSQGPYYAPQRDWALNYPAMLHKILQVLQNRSVPNLAETLMDLTGKEQDAIYEGLIEALDRYAKYCNLCREPDLAERSARELLQQSGFDDLPDWQQLGLYALMGMIMTGQLARGIREAVGAEETVGQFMKDLNRLLSEAYEKVQELDQHLGLTTGKQGGQEANSSSA